MPRNGNESEHTFRWVMIIMELTTVTQPNNWLDASRGGVFLNLLGADKGAFIRAAASTQTLCRS
jgi:hypothetical protein